MADIVAYLYSVRYFGNAGSVQQWLGGGDARRGASPATRCPASAASRRATSRSAKGLDSPAAVLAALWNHAAGHTAQRRAARSAEWPIFKPQEMADLIALLQSLGGSRPRRAADRAGKALE